MSGSSPTKILFVQSYTGLGGAETALLNLVKYLRLTAISPHVLSLEHGNGALLDQLSRLEIPVVQLPSGRLRQLHKTGAVIWQMAKTIKEGGYDLVVANGGHPNVYARCAAKLSGRKTIWWVHDLCFAEPLRSGPLGVLQSFMGADVFMANSQFTASALRRHFSGCHVETISPGVDLQKLEAASKRALQTRAANGVSNGDQVIGMFARYQVGKGHSVFLNAAARLVQSGFSSHFWVAGANIPWMEQDFSAELRNHVQKLGIQQHVHFFEDANGPELMAACDIVVQPSLQPETYGLVAAEAMALAKPVVATAHGGALEIIRDGETGFLVLPGDPLALATKLELLCSNPALRERTGMQARSHARQNLGANETARRFADLTQRTLASN